MAKTNQNGSSLTLRQRIGYGLGDAGGSFTLVMVAMYATRYYVNVLKVNTGVLATILLIWNVWDAVNDPLMGALMDKVFAKNHNPKGKFRPWILRATPLLAITAVVFFTVPTWFEGMAMVVALFFTKILYEGCYTMFNIPMGSLLSVMSTNDVERAQLSSARGFGSVVGGMLPTLFVPLILSHFGENNALSYQIAITICAAVGFVLCLLHYLWTTERNVEVLSAEQAQAKADSVKFSDILVVFRKNRPFLALCLHSVCITVMGAMMTNFGTYMYSDVLGSIALMSLGSLVGLPFQLVALGIAPKMSEKLGLVKFTRICLMASVVSYVCLFCVQTFVGVPVVVFLVWATLSQSLANVSTQMQWGMVGEAIDYNEYLTGKRTEGSIYGTFSLSRRIGGTFTSSLAVLLLGWIGYDANLAVQSAATLNGITMVYLLAPALCVLGSWVCFRFIWNLTPEVRAKMRAHLEAKKNRDADAR